MGSRMDIVPAGTRSTLTVAHVLILTHLNSENDRWHGFGLGQLALSQIIWGHGLWSSDDSR